MQAVVNQNRPDNVALGVTLIVSAVFMMSIQEALFKFFSADLSLWQPADKLVGNYPVLFNTWSGVGAWQWGVIALLAVLLVAIQLGLAGAYKSAAPSIVTILDYSYLVFVAIWDLLIFSTPPSAMTCIGMLLIVSAGVLVVRR